MMKYLLLMACLAGGARAESIDIHTELYIVAGILGGACLLLTIASIYNSVTIIGLQSQVAVLQAAGNATVKAVATAVENSPRSVKKFPEPAMQNNPYASEPRTRDPYESRPARDDPYRRQDSRGGYKMERLNSYYDDYRSGNRHHGGQPSRPYQDERRPPSGYY